MYLRMFNPLACVFFIALSTTILILLILAVSLLISAYIFFLDWTSFHVDNLLIPGVLDFLLWLVDLFAFTLCRFVVCYSFLMTFFFSSFCTIFSLTVVFLHHDFGVIIYICYFVWQGVQFFVAFFRRSGRVWVARNCRLRSTTSVRCH